jgi:hypothetical protein
MKQLSQNILDIAMNSVRAGATETLISICEDTDKHTMSITITDNGCGMSQEMLSRVMDPFCTTRTTRKVGLGIPLFKMEAEQTGGSFSISSELGVGTVVCASFDTSSIDFIPLGDLAETILSLVSASPQADFALTHRKDERQICFDTKTVRAELDGVPIDTPEVLLWIRDYLCELYEQF